MSDYLDPRDAEDEDDWDDFDAALAQYRDPRDGYNAELVFDDKNNRVSVVVYFSVNGEVIRQATAYTVPTDTDRLVNQGKICSLAYLWRTACSFLNAGGDLSWFIQGANLQWDPPSSVLDGIPLPVEPPEGFQLIATEIMDDGNFEHIFNNEDSREFIVWHEHVSVDLMSEMQMQRWIEETDRLREIEAENEEDGE